MNAQLDLNGFSNTIGSLAGNGIVTNNGGALATLAIGNDNTNTTFSGSLQNGTSALGPTKVGTGMLTLSGNNTYGGATLVSAGILQAGSANAFSPNSAFTVNGQLDLNGFEHTIGSLAGNGIVTNSGVTVPTFRIGNDNTNTTFSGILQMGLSGLTKVGTGTLTLTGDAHTYAGGTVISLGTLQLGDGGTTGSIPGNVAIDSNGILAFNRSNLLTFGGLISGAGSVQQNGTGGPVLTANNTYTGLTTINAGTLQLGNGGTTGSIAGDVLNNGILAFNRSDVVNFGGVISGAGSVQQNGIGTTVLTGNNTYTGSTTINAGALQLGNGGTTGSIAGDVLNNGILAFNRSDVLTFGGVISGAGSVQQNGTGTTVLTGNNTYTGLTTINAGALQLGNGGTTGSIAGPGNVFNNGILAFNQSGFLIFERLISGAGSVQQNGTGTTALTADNTYTGGTTINAGTLQLGNGGTTGSIAGNVLNNGIFAFNRSDVFIFGGLISGAGSVQQNGTGTTLLTGINTYTGGTSLNGGILAINSGVNLGTGPLSFNGGALQVLGGFTLSAAIDLAAGGGTLLADADTALDGPITGVGGLAKAGLGTLTLSGNNTYSGATTVSAGTLQAGSSTGFSPNSAFTVNGQLDLNGFSNTIGSLAGNGIVTNNGGASATLAIGNDNTNTDFFGILQDGASVLALAKVGTGTLTLSGDNTYGGATLVSAGTLRAGSATAFSPNSAFILNGQLDLNGFSNTIGSLAGDGTVTNNGADIATLAVGNDNTNTTFSGILE